MVSLHAQVRRVAQLFPTAIISGRGREKVQQFVKLAELYYAGRWVQLPRLQAGRSMPPMQRSAAELPEVSPSLFGTYSTLHSQRPIMGNYGEDLAVQGCSCTVCTESPPASHCVATAWTLWGQMLRARHTLTCRSNPQRNMSHSWMLCTRCALWCGVLLASATCPSHNMPHISPRL